MDLLYKLAKPVLFSLDPELAHDLATGSAGALISTPLIGDFVSSQWRYDDEVLHTEFAGLTLSNPLGMAAGFDKTGKLFPFLSKAGFGFVESGTFTAHPQPGNDKPRLFRYPELKALVNRMGFNNPGAEAAAKEFLHQDSHNQATTGILRGINIGKSKITPVEAATEDYISSLRNLYTCADYITVNVSSPNTPGLRGLQNKKELEALLKAVRTEMDALQNHSRIPLFVKIAPDMDDAGLDGVLESIEESKTDGLIVTNTSTDKSVLNLDNPPEGGLSGSPIFERSNEVLKKACKRTGGKLPLIGVGGISTAEDAIRKIQLGAGLVQIYTGYIYGGPSLPARILKGIAGHLKKEGISLSELCGSSVLN